MSPDLSLTFRRHKGMLLSSLAAVTLVWAAYSGTQGFRDLLSKRDQIRELQEQNAVIESENSQRRERVERLETNESEQDIELRKLNMSKPGETVFMLPEAEKKKAPAPKRKRR